MQSEENSEKNETQKNLADLHKKIDKMIPTREGIEWLEKERNKIFGIKNKYEALEQLSPELIGSLFSQMKDKFPSSIKLDKNSKRDALDEQVKKHPNEATICYSDINRKFFGDIVSIYYPSLSEKRGFQRLAEISLNPITLKYSAKIHRRWFDNERPGLEEKLNDLDERQVVVLFEGLNSMSKDHFSKLEALGPEPTKEEYEDYEEYREKLWKYTGDKSRLDFEAMQKAVSLIEQL